MILKNVFSDYMLVKSLFIYYTLMKCFFKYLLQTCFHKLNSPLFHLLHRWYMYLDTMYTCHIICMYVMYVREASCEASTVMYAYSVYLRVYIHTYIHEASHIYEASYIYIHTYIHTYMYCDCTLTHTHAQTQGSQNSSSCII